MTSAEAFVAVNVGHADYLKTHQPHNLPQNAAEFRSIRDLVTMVKASGSHFFDADTMALFHSTLNPDLHGGRFFITTEGSQHAVRWVAVNPKGGAAPVNRFEGNFDTLGDARAFAQHAATIIPPQSSLRPTIPPPLSTQLNSATRPINRSNARIGTPPTAHRVVR